MLQFPCIYLRCGYDKIRSYPTGRDMHGFAKRRSAVEFLLQLMDGLAGTSQHTSDLQFLFNQSGVIDKILLRHVRKWRRPAPMEGTPPEGMPTSHWWWWLHEPATLSNALYTVLGT